MKQINQSTGLCYFHEGQVRDADIIYAKQMGCRYHICKTNGLQAPPEGHQNLLPGDNP